VCRNLGGLFLRRLETTRVKLSNRDRREQSIVHCFGARASVNRRPLRFRRFHHDYHIRRSSHSAQAFQSLNLRGHPRIVTTDRRPQRFGRWNGRRRSKYRDVPIRASQCDGTSEIFSATTIGSVVYLPRNGVRARSIYMHYRPAGPLSTRLTVAERSVASGRARAVSPRANRRDPRRRRA